MTDRNPNVVVRDVELVARAWGVLRRTTLDYRGADGTWSEQVRETYDRGDGATILLYDPERRTVLLSRQFRYPVYANGHPDGMLIETAAGKLDHDGEDPEATVRREAEEELGVSVGSLTRVADVYMSPGSVTECIGLFAASYSPASRTSQGGGLEEEGEEIEILELGFDEAMAMIQDGRIADAKTIILLQWAALRGPFAPQRETA